LSFDNVIFPARQFSLPAFLLLEMIRKVRGPIVIYGDFIAVMGKKQDARIQKQFGQRVRELRKQKDLSQEGLALACDLDRTYIGGVERGERNISLLNFHKIAEALGVSAKDLLDA
jgi:DNA-binding XRE family transcriptional regulator